MSAFFGPSKAAGKLPCAVRPEQRKSAPSLEEDGTWNVTAKLRNRSLFNLWHYEAFCILRDRLGKRTKKPRSNCFERGSYSHASDVQPRLDIGVGVWSRSWWCWGSSFFTSVSGRICSRCWRSVAAAWDSIASRRCLGSGLLLSLWLSFGGRCFGCRCFGNRCWRCFASRRSRDAARNQCFAWSKIEAFAAS